MKDKLKELILDPDVAVETKRKLLGILLEEKSTPSVGPSVAESIDIYRRLREAQKSAAKSSPHNVWWGIFPPVDHSEPYCDRTRVGSSGLTYETLLNTEGTGSTYGHR